MISSLWPSRGINLLKLFM